MGRRHGLASITLTPGDLTKAAQSPSRGENRGAGAVQKKRYLCDKDGELPGGSQPGRVAEDIKEQLEDGRMDAQTKSPCPVHLKDYASSRLAGSMTEIAQGS